MKLLSLRIRRKVCTDADCSYKQTLSRRYPTTIIVTQMTEVNNDGLVLLQLV